MLEKYERVSLQLQLIAEEVESDPKSETFRYFVNLAQTELEQMQEQQNSLMYDYGFGSIRDRNNVVKLNGICAECETTLV